MITKTSPLEKIINDNPELFFEFNRKLPTYQFYNCQKDIFMIFYCINGETS